MGYFTSKEFQDEVNYLHEQSQLAEIDARTVGVGFLKLTFDGRKSSWERIDPATVLIKTEAS